MYSILPRSNAKRDRRRPKSSANMRYVCQRTPSTTQYGVAAVAMDKFDRLVSGKATELIDATPQYAGGIFSLRTQAVYQISIVNCAPARHRSIMNLRLSSVG